MEARRECIRWFNGEITILIYETDGFQIEDKLHKTWLEYDKPHWNHTLVINSRVKKTNNTRRVEE